MKNTFNWGHGITIAIILLLLLIIGFVFRVTREDIHLVTEEYYESEIEYQHKIESIKNLNELQAEVSLSMSDRAIQITFPLGSFNEQSQGTILFYKASDKNLDREFPLNINEQGQQTIPLKTLAFGKYKIFIEWSGEKDYFHEFELTIPSS